MTREELQEILNNHANEEDTLLSQFESIKQLAEQEREKLYPKGISYDGVKVMGGIALDEKLSAMVDKINKIYSQNERNLNYIAERLRQFKLVHSLVLRMDSEYKVVLLALYYPNRSLQQTATLLNRDKKHLWREKEKAIGILLKQVNERQKPTNANESH